MAFRCHGDPSPADISFVFASDKDRHTGELHTNFKISASGETLVLTDSNGTIIDRVTVPASAVDISYARIGDGGAVWGLQIPSPGTMNSGNNDRSDGRTPLSHPPAADSILQLSLCRLPPATARSSTRSMAVSRIRPQHDTPDPLLSTPPGSSAP